MTLDSHFKSLWTFFENGRFYWCFVPFSQFRIQCKNEYLRRCLWWWLLKNSFLWPLPTLASYESYVICLHGFLVKAIAVHKLFIWTDEVLVEFKFVFLEWWILVVVEHTHSLSLSCVCKILSSYFIRLGSMFMLLCSIGAARDSKVSQSQTKKSSISYCLHF